MWTSAIVFTCLAMPACSQPTDPDKKEIVYRMYAGYAEKFPEVKDISPQQAMVDMKTSKVIFVDAREPDEMKVSMLPDAVAETAFLKNPGKYGNHKVIIYCTIGYRSGRLAEKLEEKGFAAYNLKGGILAWVLEGGKIFDANGETRKIHVYGRKWDYPAEGYVSVR